MVHVAVIAAAVVLGQSLAHSLGRRQPIGDEIEYLDRADSSRPHGPVPFVRVPLFITLVRLTRRLGLGVGPTFSAVAFATIAATTTAAWISGGRLAAVIAGLLLALSPDRILMSLRVWPDVVLTFWTSTLICWIVWDRPSPTMWLIGYGLLVAGATLTRVEALAWVAPAWFLGVERGASVLESVALPSACALAALGACSIARRHRQEGAWPDDTAFFNLAVAAQERSDPGADVQTWVSRALLEWSGQPVSTRWRIALARPVSRTRRQAMRLLRTIAARSVGMLGPDTFGLAHLVPPLKGGGFPELAGRRRMAVRKVIRYSFTVGLAAGVVGFGFGTVDRRPAALVGAAFVAMVAVHARTRFRMCLLPLIMYFAAAGIEVMIEADRPAAVAAFAVLLGLLAVPGRREQSTGEVPSPDVTPLTPPSDLPFPPDGMRRLVGPTDPASFDNPTGALVFGERIPVEAYEAVLDFGCGCGRVARMLIQQSPQPSSYVGIDLHAGMIAWCQQHLAPAAPQFRFEHHDVRNLGLNPSGVALCLPLPVEDASMSLVNAWSVFTHVLQDHAVHYLAEVARVLRPGGLLHSTWFLFDKSWFPMMQDFQNALYINDNDPTNAVIFDRAWLVATLAELGLKVVGASPPEIRGYQWILVIAALDHPWPSVDLPTDDAMSGSMPPPLMPVDAPSIGL